MTKIYFFYNVITQKLKRNANKKTLYTFVEQSILPLNVKHLTRGTLFSPVFCEKLVFNEENGKKVHGSHPSYFPILHVTTNFHYDRNNIKEKKYLGNWSL